MFCPQTCNYATLLLWAEQHVRLHPTWSAAKSVWNCPLTRWHDMMAESRRIMPENILTSFLTCSDLVQCPEMRILENFSFFKAKQVRRNSFDSLWRNKAQCVLVNQIKLGVYDFIHPRAVNLHQLCLLLIFIEEISWFVNAIATFMIQTVKFYLKFFFFVVFQLIAQRFLIAFSLEIQLKWF